MTAKKKRAKSDENGTEKKQKPLDAEWQPKVPDVVQQAADDYVDSLRKLGKAREAKNSDQELLITAMKENDCNSVTVDSGNKRIVMHVDNKVKIEKVKRGEDD